MSERASAPHHEQHKPKQHAEHEASHEQVRAKHEREAHKNKAEHAPLPELKQQAEKEAIAAEDAIKTDEKETPQSDYIGREVRQQTLHRTLTRMRKQLSAPDRTLSKVIHQPFVDAVSRASGQTVARPSGLLGGSIFAFIGSSTFLWMAKHYGFQYNYLLFIFLFIGGFAIGMILELAIFAIRRSRT